MNPELMMLCLVGLGCAFVLGCVYFISRLLAQREKRLREEAELEESLAPPVAAPSSPAADGTAPSPAETQPSVPAPAPAVPTPAEAPVASVAESEDAEESGVAEDENSDLEESARPRPPRRRRSRRRDEEDEEEEPEFVVAKPMPLQAVKDFSYECAGRAQYAFDEGNFVQAYYFALLSELNGHRQAANLMAHIRVVWRQCGYPEEGFSRQSGFSRTEYMLGLSALRIDAHFDAHFGYACLEDLSADGNDLAKVLLERRQHR